jgi:hypothetical protein
MLFPEYSFVAFQNQSLNVVCNACLPQDKKIRRARRNYDEKEKQAEDI